MCQMPGKDQLGFDQGKEQTNDGGHPNYGEETAHVPRKNHQGDEGGHRGQDAKRDWDVDIEGSIQSGVKLILAGCLPAMNALPDHDGIVDEDSEHKNEGHDGQCADGDRERREEHQGAKERNRDARGNPHGQAKSQKKSEDSGDQQQSTPCIDEKRIETNNQIGRLVV